MMNQSESNYVVRASYPTRDPYPVYKFHNDPQEWHCNGSVIVSCKDGKVYIKIMDETVSPHYYNMSKSVFNKLTPLKTQSYAQKWREKVKNNFMKVKKPLFKTEKLEDGITMFTLDSFNLN